jgi:hypothetical protein
MVRITVISLTLAIVLTASATAQSPNPALLAPGQSGRMLAPTHSMSHPSYGSGSYRDVFRSRRGARLSHPSAHIH